jgi:hypothetical protein
VKELPPHGESSIIRVQDASATFEIEIAHLWDHRDVEITSHPDKTIFDGDLVTYRYLPDTDILPERACLFFGDSALCELRPVLTDGNSFQLVMNSNTRGAVDTRMTFGEEVPLEVISCKGAESCAATLDSFEFRDQITLVGR